MTLSKEEKEKLELEIHEMNKILKGLGKDVLKSEYIDVKSITLIGNYYYTTNQFEKAKDMYDLILKEFPDDTRALNNKASALRREKEREEALELYKKASEIDPDYTDPKVNMGGILSELGRASEALPILEEVYRKEKPDYVLLLNLGFTHSKLGNYPEAHEFYEKAEKLDSHDIQILLNIATLYQAENNYLKAIEFSEKILKMEPEHISALVTKGSSLMESRQMLLGIYFLEKVIKIDPKEEVALVNLALAYRRLHDFGIPRRWYADLVELYAEKALAITDDDFMALDHLGWVMNRCESYDRAFELFEKALRSKPNNTGILLDKVDALLRVDRNDEALEIVNRIIELDKPKRDVDILRIKYNLLLDMKKQSDAELFVKELEEKLSPDQIEYVKKPGRVFTRKPKN